MAKYSLNNKAVADLTDIWEYTYETWSEAQADSYYTTIIDTCSHLAENPAIGKAYPQIAENLLGYRIMRHIIFYQAVDKAPDKAIAVIRILHESMDLRNRIFED